MLGGRWNSRVSENINQSKHRRWSIFCIKQYVKAVYLSLHATNQPPHATNRIESSWSQRRCSVAGRVAGGWQGAGKGSGGSCQVILPPPGKAAGGGRAHRPNGSRTCRKWEWRHPPAGTGPGGTCHVSAGQGCRHSRGFFFGNDFQRWSLLTFH
jgi:hypothetical protein